MPTAPASSKRPRTSVDSRSTSQRDHRRCGRSPPAIGVVIASVRSAPTASRHARSAGRARRGANAPTDARCSPARSTGPGAKLRPVTPSAERLRRGQATEALAPAWRLRRCRPTRSRGQSLDIGDATASPSSAAARALSMARASSSRRASSSSSMATRLRRRSASSSRGGLRLRARASRLRFFGVRLRDGASATSPAQRPRARDRRRNDGGFGAGALGAISDATSADVLVQDGGIVAHSSAASGISKAT